MIPILSAAQVRAADAHTIGGGLSSNDLMERAASRCAKRILAAHHQGEWGEPIRIRYLVVAGPGNNGGDGLAMARMLHIAGLHVRVVRPVLGEPSPDHLVNEQRLKALDIPIQDLQEGGELRITSGEVVIDALFGTGITRPVEGLAARVIGEINASAVRVISVDMPSGLFSEDNSNNDPKAIIRATRTYTFEVPKLAQLLPENHQFTGTIELVPIGLDADHIAAQKVDHYLMQERDLVELLPKRPREGHKGTFGHALIMAGALGKAGAAVLAVKAALRSGAGTVTAHVPAAALPVLQITAPEAMCTSSGNEVLEQLPDPAPYTAIGIGPGIGVSGDTSLLLKRLLQDASSPLVMDADALNILAENRTWISFLAPNTILTPHPKEFERLLGTRCRNSFERLAMGREFAMKHRCILVLKDARTAIIDPRGKVYFNSTGNPGMAKGGSGDALTGLITGLLAQRIPALQAAMLGVHLHGSAGDLAAGHHGMDGMTVQDLIHHIPEAWRRLRNASQEINGGSLSFTDDHRITF